MNKIINGSNKYLLIIAMLVVISVVLSVTYSNFIVTSDNHKAAEMYIGSLKYSIEIDSNETNTLSLEPGVTIIDVDVNNLNPVDTYYKLLYLNNSNLEIKYFSETKDTDEVKTSYKSPNDSVTSSNTNNLKLFIRNNSDTNQNVSFSLKGGYINNTLSDISVPSGYSEITIDNSSDNTYFCKAEDSSLSYYYNGQYAYRYKAEGEFTSSGLAWHSIDGNGWGVQLNGSREDNDDPVTSKLCTYINDKPIISYRYMFCGSPAVSIDLSSFDTRNVTDMGAMFCSTKATELDVSHFDTSNVTNMSKMFRSCQAESLDLSNFDTSNVIDMKFMFFDSYVTTLDLSNFDTSNITNMSQMFSYSRATTLDLSSFDTSNVTDMDSMFSFSKVTFLDLSSFNTSKVTNMLTMFGRASNLKTIYVSTKFATNLVTSSSNMFYGCTNLVGGSGTKYNSSYVDKTYARIDGGTSSPGYFTDASVLPAKPNSFSTDSWETIVNAVRNDNVSKYNLGDTKTVDLGSYGIHTVRLVNKSTPSLCNTYRFSRSACGFVLEFADIITTHNMNPSGTYNGTSYSSGYNKDGWPASSMRTFINNDIYNALPDDLKNLIIDTSVTSSYGSGDSSVFVSTDKLYLLSSLEIWADASGSVIKYDNAKDMTRQLDYYNSLGVSTSKYSAAIKNNGSNVSYWWLRSASSNNNYGFYYVNNVGGWQVGSAFVTNGVSPAFRIG